MPAPLRFPPPDFETGHGLPLTSTPGVEHGLAWNYIDSGVLLAALGVALYLIYRRRSRRGVFWLSLFSLGYFGFFRRGCICPIGAPQDIVYALFHSDYAAPVTVLIFALAPLVTALFGGRAYCAGVCPHGAIQDFFLIKPVRVPRWLEDGLSIVPFLFLGAGLIYAATGTGFIICRYDPFVPLFRRSGSLAMLMTGGAFLLVAMFVGRPYCRFLCPYGAALRLASQASKWRVRVTPDVCTQCRLCEQSCPYGAMRPPSTATEDAQRVAVERRRLGWLLVLLPLLVVGCGAAGIRLGPAAARLNPRVQQAELYTRQQLHAVHYAAMTPEALSLQRSAVESKELLADAEVLRKRFDRAGMWFGAWFGLVVGAKLIGMATRQKRSDYEPDRGACLACARCFMTCPNERARVGA